MGCPGFDVSFYTVAKDPVAHKPQLERFLENNALLNIAQRFTNFKLADRILDNFRSALMFVKVTKVQLE